MIVDHFPAFYPTVHLMSDSSRKINYISNRTLVGIFSVLFVQQRFGVSAIINLGVNWLLNFVPPEAKRAGAHRRSLSNMLHAQAAGSTTNNIHSL